MTRTNVGVLRGGASSEYDFSLKTGAAMIQALPDDKFNTRDIYIDKQGVWHLRGMPTQPARALSQLDAVLNGLHGGAGEDGTVQRILERSGIPYVGSRPFPSAIAQNKIRAREVFQKAGLRIPRGLWFSLQDGYTTGDMARATFELIGPPYVVKPPQDGASIGILVADTLNELPDAIGDVLDEYGVALVEEFIPGKQATVGVIENFRGEELYALPPTEIVIPPGARMLEALHHEFDLHSHAVPSHFSDAQKRALMDMARAAHRSLGLSHYSRSDLIVTPNAIYLLETNSLPALYANSSYAKMLEAVGVSLHEFLGHTVSLARNG